MGDAAVPIGILIIAVLLFIGINKGLVALFRMLPESSFRIFMVSTSGRVFTFFVSLLVLFAVIMFALLHSGIQC